MCQTNSPRLRYFAYVLCILCCPAKALAFMLTSGAAAGALSTLDYRLPLILAGWTCIGLATFMMLRTRKDLMEQSQPASSRKTKD